MEESDETMPIVTETEAETNYLLGLFDGPAFVRRGHDLEYALTGLRLRLGRERDGMLDMVRLRLRQWASVATGPDDFADVFNAPVAPLWTPTRPLPLPVSSFPENGKIPAPGPATGSPSWAAQPATARRRRAVGRDLVASVTRFNHRWGLYLGRMTLESVNWQIDQYNRYYVLEKECVLGSSRLAALHFEPKPPLTPGSLLAEFPLLPVPGLVTFP
jgi:hypothetical protein